ncbi:PREDICTED: RNA polymerase I termination factor-like [Tarenaya hassleriana]|uniref:RNA polymerase I termination factor-like n=2 Tax=Tarenaya hassleriana TaxID=28532 RepID=UPI0008FD958C|nr:PREDICTED: RNA polymerase I termination factor-like [Tarenaya hassleriana]
MARYKMQGVGEESAKEKKRKAELEDSGSDGCLSVKKTKKRKKKTHKVEIGDEVCGMDETATGDEGLVEADVENKPGRLDGTCIEKDVKSTEDSSKKKKRGKNKTREDSSMRKKKKKKDKKKVSDIEASESSKKDKTSEADQRDDTPVESTDGCSGVTSRKKREKKRNSDLGADQSLENSDKERKKKRKRKHNDESGAENNTLETERSAKKKKKKKQEQTKNAEPETPSSSKSAKRVTFSDQVDMFPLSDGGVSEDEFKEDEGNVELMMGKRFSKEEDELVKAAVQEYIDNHGLAEEGLNMVMKCKSIPKVKNCWKEIAAALPWRTRSSVYYRAHILFEGDPKRSWTPEQLELVKNFAEKHGSDWKTLAEVMGKHRWHVKDAWRRIKFPNMNKIRWSREEYQTLFDLVNIDLRTKALQEKKSKHGMLRDNIPWTAISEQLGTRYHSSCCRKWYNQLTSPMVAEGIWDNSDDYRLLDELTELDAACMEDVDWDDLLENRSGELCRKRWDQMVRHIGVPGTKSFSDQVEILVG